MIGQRIQIRAFKFGYFLEKIQLTDDVVAEMSVEGGEGSHLQGMSLLLVLDDVGCMIYILFIEENSINLDVFCFGIEGLL